MKPEDAFVLWMTGAVLRSADEEVQAILLDEFAAHVEHGEDLDSVLARSINSERQSGDFGMEIAGSLLLPVLIEVGKQFWEAYTKKLADKAADKLATATIAGIQSMVRKIWSDRDIQDLPDNLVELITATGEKQGLETEQIEKLVTAIRSQSFMNELRAEQSGI